MINVVLYRPEIPQNTGNIMRTCMASGAHLHIIGPLPFQLDEKALKRAGMDYIDELRWTYYENYEQFQQKHENVEIYYITRYGHKSHDMGNFADIVKNIYIMFGRESTGIPHEILLNHEDNCLRIPMVINARSLNLSNAVAIVVYEVLRQQKYYGMATEEAIKGPNFLINEVKANEK